MPRIVQQDYCDEGGGDKDADVDKWYGMVWYGMVVEKNLYNCSNSFIWTIGLCKRPKERRV